MGRAGEHLGSTLSLVLHGTPPFENPLLEGVLKQRKRAFHLRTDKIGLGYKYMCEARQVSWVVNQPGWGRWSHSLSSGDLQKYGADIQPVGVLTLPSEDAWSCPGRSWSSGPEVGPHWLPDVCFLGPCVCAPRKNQSPSRAAGEEKLPTEAELGQGRWEECTRQR